MAFKMSLFWNMTLTLSRGPQSINGLRNWAAQQEVSLNVMYWNHLQTSPPTPVQEKLYSTKPVPGAKKDRDY